MKNQKFKQTEIGKIPEDWDVDILSNHIDIIGGGTPKTNVKDYWNGDLPWISVVDFVGDSKWIYDTEKHITDRGLENSSTKLLHKGQIIISARGTVGELGQVTRDMAFNQSCYGINGRKGIDNNYLYYLLKQKIREFQQKGHGAVFNTITTKTFSQIVIPILDLKEQISIAKILSDLDAKIELNNKMNKILEEIGQALFKKWFADELENGDENFGNFIEFIKGKKPNDTSQIKIEGYKNQILIDNLNGGTSIYANPHKTVNVNLYDTIMVMDGASSGRVEIGHEGILGSTLAKIIPKENKLSGFFIYYFLKYHEQDINANTTGTSIPHTDKGKINNLQLAEPSKDKLDKFNKISKYLLDQVILNKNESTGLSQIRDSLLPKLMSGEIRVR